MFDEVGTITVEMNIHNDDLVMEIFSICGFKGSSQLDRVSDCELVFTFEQEDIDDGSCGKIVKGLMNFEVSFKVEFN